MKSRFWWIVSFFFLFWHQASHHAFAEVKCCHVILSVFPAYIYFCWICIMESHASLSASSPCLLCNRGTITRLLLILKKTSELCWFHQYMHDVFHKLQPESPECTRKIAKNMLDCEILWTKWSNYCVLWLKTETAFMLCDYSRVQFGVSQWKRDALPPFPTKTSHMCSDCRSLSNTFAMFQTHLHLHV